MIEPQMLITPTQFTTTELVALENTETEMTVDSASAVNIGDIIRVRCVNTTTETYWMIYCVAQSVQSGTELTVAVMWVEDTLQAY